MRTRCYNRIYEDNVAGRLDDEKFAMIPYALRELVKAIYVEAPDKSSGKRKQKIHISYDLIGFIPVDVLLKAEQA